MTRGASLVFLGWLAALAILTSGCRWVSAIPEMDAGDAIPPSSSSAATTAEDGGAGTSEPPSAAGAVDASALTLGEATAVAAGGQHTCALSQAGAVWCWGSGSAGQIGRAGAGSLVPVAVTAVGARVVAVTAGDDHTCALSLADAGSAGSEVQCWGRNDHFQLGAMLPSTSAAPIAVAGLGADVTAIAAGGLHTCAIAGGEVFCWGDGADGQLGNGATTDRATPVRVSSLTGVTALAAGGAHTCALTSAGAVWCWGFNVYGQLGSGNTTRSTIPVQVTGLSSGVTSVSAGTSHTCAIKGSGGAVCWGFGLFGQLGNGAIASSPVPVAVSALGSGQRAIAAGGTHSCALSTSGTISCWGDDQSGQLGDDGSTDSALPVAVTNLSIAATSLSAGVAHTCALGTGSSGGMQCWGWNIAGQLGNDTADDSPAPVGVCGF